MPQERHEDHKYIEALLNNDQHLIKEIYEKWQKDVLSFVLKNNGNKQDAADIFQESILALLILARRGNFILTVPLGGLLNLIFRRRWFGVLKRKRKETEIIQELKAYSDDKVSNIIAYEASKAYNEKKLFDFCFEKLGDRCKKILKLSLSGLSRVEMMPELESKSENAVNQSVFRCRAKLKELIKQYRSRIN